MRSIAIVGAGQAGLPLALALLDKGYQVTVATSRAPDDIRRGKVMSSQCMFGASLQIERDLGLNAWEAECPPVDGIGLTVPDPEKPGRTLIEWAHRLDRPAQSVDQRIKMPAWMEQVEQRGGRLLVIDVGIAELESLARTHELVVVAAGKGDVVKSFERDAARSPYDAPQRALALTYVHGMKETAGFSRVAFNLIPGVGEVFVIPALTATGPCHIMVFEGIPGGPMDCWHRIDSPADHLARSLAILRKYLPWEAERARNVELTDANGTLAGSYAPTVRRPVMRLPSGKFVLGLADAVVLNDPITGQGSGNAMKASKSYLDAIVARADGAFTPEWMRETFESSWRATERATVWTNSLLQPPPPHILQLLGAAQQTPSIARAIVNGFDDPATLFPWWMDARACERFIAERQQSPAGA